MDQIFDVVNCPLNRANRERLLDLFIEGNAVLFVGSGCSIGLKYPSWYDTILSLRSKIEIEKVEKLLEIDKVIGQEDLLLAAEMIKQNILADEYEDYYKETFKPASPSYAPLHSKLVRLKTKGFITTNYDPALTGALNVIQPYSDASVLVSDTTRSALHQFVRSLSGSGDTKRMVLYQHGYYNSRKSRILSYGEYVQKYSGLDIKELLLFDDLMKGNIDVKAFENRNKLTKHSKRTLHYTTMYCLMATQRLVYVGYGLRDPFLNKITEDMSHDFQRDNDGFHFAIIRVTQEELGRLTEEEYAKVIDRWKWLGIDLVYYLDNGQGSGLTDFISGFPPEAFIADKLEPEGSKATEKVEPTVGKSTLTVDALKKISLNKNKTIREGEN